jgi:hypothetical protein
MEELIENGLGVLSVLAMAGAVAFVFGAGAIYLWGRFLALSAGCLCNS